MVESLTQIGEESSRSGQLRKINQSVANSAARKLAGDPNAFGPCFHLASPKE